MPGHFVLRDTILPLPQFTRFRDTRSQHQACPHLLQASRRATDLSTAQQSGSQQWATSPRASGTENSSRQSQRRPQSGRRGRRPAAPPLPPTPRCRPASVFRQGSGRQAQAARPWRARGGTGKEQLLGAAAMMACAFLGVAGSLGILPLTLPLPPAAGGVGVAPSGVAAAAVVATQRQQQAGGQARGLARGPCRQAWRDGCLVAAGGGPARQGAQACRRGWGPRRAARRRRQRGGRSGIGSSVQRCSSGRSPPWRCDELPKGWPGAQLVVQRTGLHALHAADK